MVVNKRLLCSCKNSAYWKIIQRCRCVIAFSLIIILFEFVITIALIADIEIHLCDQSNISVDDYRKIYEKLKIANRNIESLKNINEIEDSREVLNLTEKMMKLLTSKESQLNETLNEEGKLWEPCIEVIKAKLIPFAIILLCFLISLVPFLIFTCYQVCYSPNIPTEEGLSFQTFTDYVIALAMVLHIIFTLMFVFYVRYLVFLNVNTLLIS